MGRVMGILARDKGDWSWFSSPLIGVNGGVTGWEEGGVELRFLGLRLGEEPDRLSGTTGLRAGLPWSLR